MGEYCMAFKKFRRKNTAVIVKHDWCSIHKPKKNKTWPTMGMLSFNLESKDLSTRPCSPECIGAGFFNNCIVIALIDHGPLLTYSLITFQYCNVSKSFKKYDLRITLCDYCYFQFFYSSNNLLVSVLAFHKTVMYNFMKYNKIISKLLTKIIKVNLSVFVYRLVHEDFSPIARIKCETLLYVNVHCQIVEHCTIQKIPILTSTIFSLYVIGLA